ncbi:MAG: sulfotransferase [Candidatus Hydrogenedentes bacterium]|nr:sulfotransferase [Candidatus Hydrogenedentota bacterium]
MPKALRAFLELLKLTLLHSKGTHAQFTARRLRVMAVFLPVLLIGQLIHWAGFLLDEIFFRGYRKIAIKDPVFIVGIPRSGTTLLHRVMAQDTESFTSLKLWEILIAPSITERKFWTVLGHMDRVCGGHGRRFLVAADTRILRRLSEIHKMSLFDYDEDDMVLTPVFASVYLFFPFPFRDELWWLVRFDEDTPHGDKERIMRFYKTCVQRHLYFHGPEKRFLSKNPAFSSKVDSIRTHFPDARVVCNMRSPYETIPSLLSALYVAWDVFANDLKADEYRDCVLELAGHWYRHPIERSREWPDEQFAFVNYDELRKDLKGTVSGLYSRFGFEAGPVFLDRLNKEHEMARVYSSTHLYSLEQFGLTPEDILEDFGDIFQRFGFDTACPGAVQTEKQRV